MGHNPPSDRRKWAQLKQWAVDGRIVRVHCNLCRRTMHFYAADLAQVYDPEMLAHEWRPACSQCGKSDWVSVRSRFPGPDDVGRTIMRRPDGIRQIQLWKNELYGLSTEPSNAEKS